MLEIKLGLFVILLHLSALAFSDDGSSCVDNYLDFSVRNSSALAEQGRGVAMVRFGGTHSEKWLRV